MEILFEISQILNTGLDRASLRILISLTESGANPEALAAVVLHSGQPAAAAVIKAIQPQDSLSLIHSHSSRAVGKD